jgi:cob(I)alamin adenosyltransferase
VLLLFDHSREAQISFPVTVKSPRYPLQIHSDDNYAGYDSQTVYIGGITMIHVYCGDGKGKTTAALGLILRHVGAGGKAVLAQFLKSTPTGELAALEALGVPVYRNELPHGFFPGMSEETKANVRKLHDRTLSEVSRIAKANECSLLVLDELSAALALELIDREKVFALLNDHGEAELVITGRDPDPELLARADYVTEMKLVKHPYDKGVKARKGIEY